MNTLYGKLRPPTPGKLTLIFSFILDNYFKAYYFDPLSVMVYDTPPLSKSVAIPTLLQSYDTTRSSWYVIYMLTKLFCTFYLAYGTLNTTSM